MSPHPQARINLITVPNMRHSFASLMACVAVTTGLPAIGADLVSVYRAAQEHDSVLAEARAKREAAEEKITQGRANLLPNIALTGHTSYNRERVERQVPNQTNHWDFNGYGYALTLTQPLFHWQHWLGYDQSKLTVAQAETALANAKQELILRTTQAYFDVLQATANLQAAESLKSSVSGQLDIAQKAFSIGTGIKTDVHDAQTRYQLASSQLIATQTDLELRKRLLESIMGGPLSHLTKKLEGIAVAPPRPNDLSKWAEGAEQGNLAIQQQRLLVEIARREVDRQRAGHYPTLHLMASVGRDSTLNSGTREISDNEKISLQLNVPIFEGNAVASRTSEAAANHRAAQFALETVRKSAIVNAQQAYLGVINGLAQVRTLQAAYQAAQNAVTSNKDAFDVGVRLSVDVLNAQSQVFNTYRELNRAMVDTLMAQLKLKAAVGSLGEEDVISINSWLQTSSR